MQRILFVSCNYASDYGPMVWGTYIRMRMLLEAASAAADAVDLLLFVAPDLADAANAESIAASIRTHWHVDVTVHIARRSRRPHAGWIASLRALGDMRFQPEYGEAGDVEQAHAVANALTPSTMLVVAHRLDAALAVIDGVRGRVPIAVNFDDIEHVAKARRVARDPASPGRLLQSARVAAIRRAEIGVMRAADVLLVCSGDERSYLARLGVATAIDVCRNAVPFPASIVRDPMSTRTIMFIGSYGYEPNIEAAEELMTRIFPRVVTSIPDARLLIAGARPERLPSAARPPPGVTILGFVDDVASIYQRAGIACCAIRAGGGTRIKIIEAAAWRMPTVSTPLGAEGLELEDGREVLLEASSEALADACIRLIRDPALAASIGNAARARIARDYERGEVVGRIADSYRRVARA